MPVLACTNSISVDNILTLDTHADRQIDGQKVELQQAVPNAHSTAVYACTANTVHVNPNTNLLQDKHTTA